MGIKKKYVNWQEIDKQISNLASQISSNTGVEVDYVVGIPRGGLTLSSYLNEHSTQNPEDPYLIVDDVLTTGGSMNYFVEQYFRNREPNEYFGWVVFARKKPAAWIKALFQMPKFWVDDPNKREYNK